MVPKNRLSKYPAPVDKGLLAPQVSAVMGLGPQVSRYRMGALEIFVEQDPEVGYHMLVVHPGTHGQIACLDEVVKARAALVPPGVRMAIILPPSESDYLRANTLELWEVRHVDELEGSGVPALPRGVPQAPHSLPTV